MNICHFSYSFFPLVGGMEAFIDNLARCQMADGMTPTIFTPYVRKKDNAVESPYEVVRFSRPSSRRIGLEQLLVPMGLLHNRCRFDLIHCHDAFPCGYISQLFSRLTSVPYIITSHGGDIVETAPGIVKSASQTKKIERAYSGAAAICAISRDMKERILSLGAPTSTITNISNGVHIGDFTTEEPYSSRWSTPHPYLLCIGRLVESKGVDHLLRAFAMVTVNHPGVILKIAGGGKAATQLKSLARELNLDKRIEFLGTVTGHEKVKLFQNALACVSPTLKEAFGIVNIEALAAGTPVIASNVGGLPDIITHESNGLLVEPANAEALADTLNRFLSDPGTATAMAAQCLPSVQQFDWQVIHKHYCDLYSSCLSRRPPIDELR